VGIEHALPGDHHGAFIVRVDVIAVTKEHA